MILLGNSFPLSLVRRPVCIKPATLESLRDRIKREGAVSFWGHENTRAAASKLLGFDVAPEIPRPALTLSDDALPVFNGQVFREVWILSPDYPPGYRPPLNRETEAAEIMGWQVLHLSFP